MLEDKKLKQLALDWVQGNIFTSFSLKPEEMPQHFIPIAFANEKQIPDDVGMVYEYMRNATPTACNGKPTFFSCKFLGAEDTKKVIEYTDKLKAAMKEALT